MPIAQFEGKALVFNNGVIDVLQGETSLVDENKVAHIPTSSVEIDEHTIITNANHKLEVPIDNNTIFVDRDGFIKANGLPELPQDSEGNFTLKFVNGQLLWEDSNDYLQYQMNGDTLGLFYGKRNYDLNKVKPNSFASLAPKVVNEMEGTQGIPADKFPGLFKGIASDFLEVDLDTSAATDMTDMFNGCPNLVTLDIKSFDTENVTDMEGMFNNCPSLYWIQADKNQEYGGNWSINLDSTDYDMFNPDQLLKQLEYHDEDHPDYTANKASDYVSEYKAPDFYSILDSEGITSEGPFIMYNDYTKVFFGSDRMFYITKPQIMQRLGLMPIECDDFAGNIDNYRMKIVQNSEGYYNLIIDNDNYQNSYIHSNAEIGDNLFDISWDEVYSSEDLDHLKEEYGEHCIDWNLTRLSNGNYKIESVQYPGYFVTIPNYEAGKGILVDPNNQPQWSQWSSDEQEYYSHLSELSQFELYAKFN